MKVNLHITESCNYGCRYCFAKFGKHSALSIQDWLDIIDNCAASGIVDSINFAGGEPLLYPGLSILAEHAKSLGLETSVISNGSLINKNWIEANANLYDTIGISFDSFNENTSKNLNCCDKNGKTLSGEELKRICEDLKAANPDIKIKINTVVSACNINETPMTYLQEYDMPVDRWKLLRIKPFNNNRIDNSKLLINDDQYANFVENQLRGANIIIKDNNSRYIAGGIEIIAESEMGGAYIMIDAGGYLVDTIGNGDYDRIANLKIESFADAFGKLDLNENLYDARYAKNRQILYA